MKRLICLIMLFLISPISYAAYCPNVDEFSQDAIKMQQKGLNMYKAAQDESSNTDVDPLDILNDANNLMNNTVNNCISYFKTTPNPECTKFHSLSTAYILMGLTNIENANKVKKQIEEIKDICPNEYAGFEQVQKQFGNHQLKY